MNGLKGYGRNVGVEIKLKDGEKLVFFECGDVEEIHWDDYVRNYTVVRQKAGGMLCMIYNSEIAYIKYLYNEE